MKSPVNAPTTCISNSKHNLRKKFKEQLRRNVELGMIEYIEGLTPQVSPIAVAPKRKSSGKIWVGVNLLQASRAIKEVFRYLNGTKMFRKLESTKGTIGSS